MSNNEESAPSNRLPAWLPKSKKSAFFNHLILSSVIFIVLAAIIYFAMFPGALFFAAGGIDGIKIVAGVDLVLGPVLMLVVYNARKKLKEIIMDVSIVFTIQFVCLALGVFIVYQERPASVTFVGDKIFIKKLKELKEHQASSNLIESLDCMKPSYFYVDIPKTNVNDIILMLANQKDVLAIKTELYKKLPKNRQSLERQLYKELDGECVELEFSSAYEEGTVCFNYRDFSMTNFRAKM